jgi:hypothetical protein
VGIGHEVDPLLFSPAIVDGAQGGSHARLPARDPAP